VGDFEAAERKARWFLERFGKGRFWIELQHHLYPQDGIAMAQGAALAERLGVGYVATNNVHYARPEERRLQDVLVCIRNNRTLDEAVAFLRPNAEFYLKSASEMARRFHSFPDAIRNSRRIAEQCEFELTPSLQELPLFAVPNGMSGVEYLRHLCDTAIPRRYGETACKVWEQLEYELGVIERSGLVNYFLVIWDVVRFAREAGILCQGRGSACSSLVAYLLEISSIDPIAHHLVFERFLSDERRVVPDIDIDFDSQRREEVIQYLYSRYGHEHVAMACTFSTYQARSAIRDIGKVLEIPLPLLERVIKSIDGHQSSWLTHSELLQTLAAEAPVWQQLVMLADAIGNAPRHLSLHNGGMVLSKEPLAMRVPIEPGAMTGRTVTQWDKDGLEDNGIIKLDILGLRMLSAIAEARETVEATTTGDPFDLHSLSFDDPNVFQLIAEAETVGVFQTESGAQMNMLPRLKPKCFNDLVVAISLIRPGPIQGEMVHPYLRRRAGEEPVTYHHPLLEGVLEDSLGIILWQEQVLQVAQALAGFSGGQGEQLRRALGKKRATQEIERFREIFLQGAAQQGVTQEVASKVFEQLKAFGNFSFARSHAAAFAVPVYWSAYLKYYHPAAFFAALLNNQPMGFWSPSVLVNDAQRRSVRVLSVSVNESNFRCEVVEEALRIGFNYVLGLGERDSRRITLARQAEGRFINLMDFCVQHLVLVHLSAPSLFMTHCVILYADGGAP